jgi:hypothetical protein
MRKVQSPSSEISTLGHTQSPAVPISLYREVASELQATKTQVETLKTQNQQLVEQNQQLRVEIERVVQTALRLRQIADAHRHDSQSQPTATPNVEVHFVGAKASDASVYFNPANNHGNEPDRTPDHLYTEQEVKPQRSMTADRAAEVSGWWLILIVFVIVVTAFGMGFAILSSLLPKR